MKSIINCFKENIEKNAQINLNPGGNHVSNMSLIWIFVRNHLWLSCPIAGVQNRYPTFVETREHQLKYLDVPIYHLKCSSGYKHYFKIFSSSNICYHLKQQSVCNADRVRYMYQYHIAREPLSANSYIDLHGG